MSSPYKLTRRYDEARHVDIKTNDSWIYFEVDAHFMSIKSRLRDGSKEVRIMGDEIEERDEIEEGAHDNVLQRQQQVRDDRVYIAKDGKISSYSFEKEDLKPCVNKDFYISSDKLKLVEEYDNLKGNLDHKATFIVGFDGLVFISYKFKGICHGEIYCMKTRTTLFYDELHLMSLYNPERSESDEEYREPILRCLGYPINILYHEDKILLYHYRKMETPDYNFVFEFSC